MKKTMTILALVLVAATSNIFAMAKPVKKSVPNENNPTGVYTLVTIDGAKLPATISHGGELKVHSGAFTINADGTCVSKTVFGPPSGEKIDRQVSATYTQKGSKLYMQWKGAGKTEGTVKGDTFTMNNEGMIFSYKKQPEQ